MTGAPTAPTPTVTDNSTRIATTAYVQALAGSASVTLTGDVTGSGIGSFITTIAPSSVTLAKIANIPAYTIIGNNTGSANNPSSLTVSHALNLLGSGNDATGSGVVVLANTPTLVTPNLGDASATTINKVTITPPSSGATLTLSNGSSLIVSGGYSTTFVSSAITSVTLPTSGTLVANTANNWNGNQGSVATTLADAITIYPDFSLSNTYSLVLTGNHTLGLPTGLLVNKRSSITLDIWQNSTGNNTLSFAWCYQWPSGAQGILSTGALARDKLFGDVSYYNTANVTISIATPGVITWNNHGLLTGMRLQLTTTGALPTGLSTGISYYVIVVDANTFSLATSLANAATLTKIATSGTQSGTHTATACCIDLTLVKAFS